MTRKTATTPAIRVAIQTATGSDYDLARRFKVSRATIRKWRQRESIEDASRTPHRLKTTLTAIQEEVVVYLRTHLLLSLDDLLAVVREFIDSSMSRSALDRLLRRRGHSRLPARPARASKAGTPGYVLVDRLRLPLMHGESRLRSLFVAIDRPTRWVFVRVDPRGAGHPLAAFLDALAGTAPFRIHTLATRDGRTFSGHLCGERATQTLANDFSRLCRSLGCDHPSSVAEASSTRSAGDGIGRIDGGIDRILRTHQFDGADDLDATLHRYVWLYNEHLTQKALDHLTPVDAMKTWHASHPHLFVRPVRNQAGSDAYLNSARRMLTQSAPCTPPGSPTTTTSRLPRHWRPKGASEIDSMILGNTDR